MGKLPTAWMINSREEDAQWRAISSTARLSAVPLSRSMPPCRGGKVNVISPRSQSSAATSRLNSPFSSIDAAKGAIFSLAARRTVSASILSSSVSANMVSPSRWIFSASHILYRPWERDRLFRQQRGGKPRNVGDGEDAAQQQEQEGEDRAAHLAERFIEAVRGHEEVHPHGGHQEAELEVREEDDPEVDGVHAERRGERSDDRDHDHDRREDVHEGADEEQEHVQDEEEGEPGVDRRADPFEKDLGYPGVDHVPRETRGRREEKQEPPDEPGGLGPRFGYDPPEPRVTVHEHLGADGVEDRDRRRLDGGGDAPENPQQHDHGQEKIPLRLPRRRAKLRPGERRPPRPRPHPFADGPARHDQREEDPGEDAAEKQ